MKNDLISRSALWSDIQMLPHNGDIVSSEEVEQTIKEAPAVDAVEVIKCRDCFYWMKAKVNRSGFLVCPKSGMEIVATDYCSRAERRKCK